MGDGSVMGGSRGVEGSRGGESWRGVVEGSRGGESGVEVPITGETLPLQGSILLLLPSTHVSKPSTVFIFMRS
jgi:hypothetical protein